MRIIILGSSGMLGHKLFQQLARDYDVWGTVRNTTSTALKIQGIDQTHLVDQVSGFDFDTVRQAIDTVSPSVVINCIGIIKQIDEAKDAVTSISINSLLPHQLADLCTNNGIRLIHFSTDCVFSGRSGPYSENDHPDAADLYGRSKLLGEVDRPGCLTIRTSIIGRELRRGTGLFEWFYAQRGKAVRGYRHALYSGLTTLAMADVVQLVLESHPTLSGVWHVGGDPIDKCSLLELINQVYELGVHIEPDDSFHCDRRLDSSRFRQLTGWQPPSWANMIESMRNDPFM